MKTYEECLKTVASDFPGIFADVIRVWNMDKTHISV